MDRNRIKEDRGVKFWETLRRQLVATAYVEAAHMVVTEFTEHYGGWRRFDNRAAILVLRKFLQEALVQGKFDLMAKLLWGDSIHVDQRFSKKIWDKLPQSSELIVLGGGSVGKSYTAGAWFALDFIQDPLYTSVKVVSVTKSHASTNIFAHLSSFVQKSAIPLGMQITSGWITANPVDKKNGIQLVAIPKGEKGKGRLQGMHPSPRPSHPKFGELSRVRALLDEAEEIPEGVHADIDNMLTAKDGPDRVKVCACANPRYREREFLKRAEPECGWDEADIETYEEWKSKVGFDVLRFDPAKCENVTQKRVIYPGLQTYEGYERYLRQEGSAEYYTMGRGWPPPQGAYPTVMAPYLASRARGAFMFTGGAVTIAAVDLAFTGVDDLVMAVGRFGTAAGYVSAGQTVKFDAPKVCLEVFDIFEMTKGDSVSTARDIQHNCKAMGIRPECLAVDQTGNGKGVYDILKRTFGDVLGIHYGTKATNMKVLSDDLLAAHDIYSGVNTEMAFAMSKWIEAGFIKFSDKCELENWEDELIDRRYKVVGEKVRIEGKDEYKARTGRGSPDRADASGMILHLARVRHSLRAFAVTDVKIEQAESDEHEVLDQIE